MAREEICSKCLRPKTSAVGGSITQWVVSCVCDAPFSQNNDEEQQQEVLGLDLCTKCGKRIGAGRRGSFTQFIFRSQLCACGKVVNQDFLPEPHDPSFNIEIDDNEDEIELDAGKFPLERYKPLERLGRGGEGSVFRCRDRLLNKLVTVKTLDLMEPHQLVAFNESARANSRLVHEAIIQVLDFDVTETGVPYTVLEYFPSTGLHQYLKNHGPMGWEQADELFVRLAQALSYCHAHEILHGDIKPANILLASPDSTDCDIRLIDFSFPVARDLYRGGAEIEASARGPVGTPAYMAPELADGKTYDIACEIYSFGCVLFECLTGEQPFQAESTFDLMIKHINERAPRLQSVVDIEFGEPAEELVGRCLEKDPEARFHSMSEVVAGFDSVSGRQIDDQVPVRTKVSGSLLPAFVILIALGLCAFGYIQFRALDSTPSPGRFETGSVKEKAPVEASRFYAVDVAKGLIHAGGTIGKAEFEKLASRKELYSLQLLIESKVDWSAIPALSKSSLKSLILTNTNVRDSDLVYIAKISKLKVLCLDGCQITDAGIPHLRDLALSDLSIQQTDIGPRGIEQVSKIKTLTHLDLQALKKVKGVDLEPLKNLPLLHHLDINSTTFGEEGMRIISQLPIVDLEANAAGVTDKGLELLSGSKTLQIIEIDANPLLTDRGVKYLRAIKSLKVAR
ncbi:MAG: protein kinase, partial [Candidatus Obscuribacterales bacterium]|nr:protein kinase [Candidatus Obscuribacterales bacterium]